MDEDEIRNLHPTKIRKLIRKGEFSNSTEGCADGYAQANLVILPEKNAFEFFLFCHRNPKPCPVLEVTEPGNSILKDLAEGADVRTDLPRYRIYEKGECVGDVEQNRSWIFGEMISWPS